MGMQLKLKHWTQDYDFRELSWLDGSLTKLVRKHKLAEGEAVVVTSKGWHRLRLIARIGNRAVMIIPDSHNAPLEVLSEWVAQSLRDGIVMLKDYQALKAA